MILKIGHNQSIYTMEIGMRYKLELLPHRELVVKYLPAHHWAKVSLYLA